MDGRDPILSTLEGALLCMALGVALSLRPWRMAHGPLGSAALASLALLPWLWLLPQKLPGGLQIQFSGASALVLMLGWPLAVPVLVGVAMVVWALGALPAEMVLSQLVWVGLVPATTALLVGAALRRWLPPNPFVYTLGRGFLGTAVAVFVAGVVYEATYHVVAGVSLHEALVARWLMAWGDAFITGMIAAVFVAFAPQYLATWSDQRYLAKPPSDT